MVRPKPIMASVVTKTCHRMCFGRVVFIAALTQIIALLLLVFVAAQGDSDLPPYIPATTTENICSLAALVLVWPMLAAGRVLGDHAPGILVLPLSILSGLFWGIAFECLLIVKNARRA